MKKMVYVVRVCLDPQTERWLPDGGTSPILDCLRYAGLVKVHNPTPLGFACFDILPPSNIDSREWAERNADRMKSFGFIAEAAPKSE